MAISDTLQRSAVDAELIHAVQVRLNDVMIATFPLFGGCRTGNTGVMMTTSHPFPPANNSFPGANNNPSTSLASSSKSTPCEASLSILPHIAATGKKRKIQHKTPPSPQKYCSAEAVVPTLLPSSQSPNIANPLSPELLFQNSSTKHQKHPTVFNMPLHRLNLMDSRFANMQAYYNFMVNVASQFAPHGILKTSAATPPPIDNGTVVESSSVSDAVAEENGKRSAKLSDKHQIKDVGGNDDSANNKEDEIIIVDVENVDNGNDGNNNAERKVSCSTIRHELYTKSDSDDEQQKLKEDVENGRCKKRKLADDSGIHSPLLDSSDGSGSDICVSQQQQPLSLWQPFLS